MSGTEETLKFGEALPDQVEKISKLYEAHIELTSDLQDLYNARIALERDYASKMQALTRKASERKARMDLPLILGSDPNPGWDEDTLKKSTLSNAYQELIDSFIGSAQDHITFADAAATQVVEVLRVIGKRSHDTLRKELDFFQKLLLDRDRIYSEGVKSKKKYDDDCAEVESIRQKQGRANDDRHAERAAKQAEQQRNEMLNSKNVYLISNAVSNAVKGKFYGEDIPDLENELQTLQAHLVRQIVDALRVSQNVSLSYLDNAKSRIAKVVTQLDSVNAAKDQDLFIQHNRRTFLPVPDWIFEASPIHYDTDQFSVEPAPKIFMQNKLSQGREKLSELRAVVATKREEVNQLSPKDAQGEISDVFLEARHQVVFYATSEAILEAEVNTIIAGVGDIEERDRHPHDLKPASFSIPAHCSYCKSSIWGLSKQGKTCKACGISVHTRCELKVPADCQVGGETPRSSISLFKSSTISSRPSVEEIPHIDTVPPSASSFVRLEAPSPEDTTEGQAQAKVLFDFTTTSEFELGVTEGTVVRVLEADDGSGWVKVINESGESGLVPASYLEMGTGERGVPPTVGEKGTKRVRAIYPYQSQSTDELDLQEGDILELSSGPTGGENFGGGWWEGFNKVGKKGIFPSNYVEVI